MAKVLCVDGLQKVSPWKKMHFSKRYLYIVQFRGWTVPDWLCDLQDFTTIAIAIYTYNYHETRVLCSKQN